MAESRLLTAEEYIVALDYGQFYLYHNGLEADEPIDYAELVDRAIESDGITQIPGFLVVLSPHQNNFDAIADRGVGWPGTR